MSRFAACLVIPWFLSGLLSPHYARTASGDPVFFSFSFFLYIYIWGGGGGGGGGEREREREVGEGEYTTYKKVLAMFVDSKSTDVLLG
jgi:hypothetical protein